MNIITVCGSLKFQDEIMRITEKLALQGNCMLSIVYPTRTDQYAYTIEEKELLGNLHKERIRISDAVFIVDIDAYIGSSTRSEIEFAKSLNKEIMYYSEIDDI